MKLVKFSLAAIIALSSSAFGADSLADAFKEGKVEGKVQAYYWQRDKGVDADIMNFGLDLSYETGRFYGFGLKSTFQSSSSPFADKDAKTVFNGDMYGSGSQLSELYLSYAAGKTTAQVGRMYFATPLIYGSGSRMNKESFEGALITNSDIPDTKVTLGYVQKMQTRTDGEGNFGKFTKSFDWLNEIEDDAYTIVVENSSLPNVNLTLAYLDVKDFMEVTYAEASFKKGIFGLASQYYDSKREGYKRTDLFGLKATLDLGKLSLLAAYTTTGDDYVHAGLGNGADYAFTGSPILSDTYGANSDAYKIGVAYKLTPALNVGMNYVLDDYDKKEYSYTSVTADYTFDAGVFKDLNVAVLYDDAGRDKDHKELRVNLTFPFSL